MWQTNLQSDIEPVGAILHIGAGGCGELPDYLQAQAELIVLVEPAPEAVAELRRKTASLSNITLLPVAVALENGLAPLHVFNFPAMSSLREPTGLLDLLPGLRTASLPMVKTVTPRELLEQVPLAAEKANWLVLEAPGEEMAILEALHLNGDLRSFQHIVLRCGKEAFFQGSADMRSVLQWLDQCAYTREGAVDDADPDWPCCHLRLDAVKLENAWLKERAEQVARERQELEAERNGWQAKSAELQKRLEKADQARGEQEKLANERLEQIERLTRARDEHAELAAERQARIQQLEAKLADMADLADIEARQALLVEEMARAEGQIDLIKDVLLREPGL